MGPSRRVRACLALLGAVVAAVSPAPGLRAQEPEPPPAAPDTLQQPEPASVTRDTSEATEAGQASADREQPVSPVGAMVRSVIVPGWGQAAARQPARGAIYFTVWSGGVFMILKTNAEANAAGRAEDEELQESRKRAREDWMLFTGIWALISGVDAWVSAQFAGFEGEVRPPQDGSPGVEFRYPVKLF